MEVTEPGRRQQLHTASMTIEAKKVTAALTTGATKAKKAAAFTA